MPDVDLAIIGGGCAGLSLATRLAGHGVSASIVEPRDAYTNDRTWSFWRTAPHDYEDMLQGSWPAWSVAGPSGLTRCEAAGVPYQTISGGAFYDRALQRIDAADGIDLTLKTRVSGLYRRRDGWQVDTDHGSFTARHVVDTRPPTHRPAYGQFFLGREIATARPVFDPGCAQIMHFRSGYSRGVDFLYVLPFARDRALVEVTSFAPEAPTDAAFANWLDAEIDALETGGYDVLREERGALPMEVGYAAPTVPGIARMGIAGGAARPATGYAFQRIQAQADKVAADLIAGRAPRTPGSNALTATMDAIFLRVLAAAPARGPALFQALFDRVAPKRLVRFLSDQPHMADRLSVVTALPPLPFLAAAARLT